MLSIYRAGEIDLFENLDIVHIRLLVAMRSTFSNPKQLVSVLELRNIYCIAPHPSKATANVGFMHDGVSCVPGNNYTGGNYVESGGVV